MSEKPFSKALQTVELKNGTKVELPRLTLGKIMLVTDGVGKLTEAIKEKAPSLFAIFSGGGQDSLAMGAEIMQTLPAVLPAVLKEVIQVISAYTGVSEKTIEDEWDAEDLVAVATPFFESILEQGSHLVKPLTSLFPKPTVTSSESSAS